MGWIWPVLPWKRRMSEQKPKQVNSVPTASDRFDWALHPRRSQLAPDVRVKDPFEHGNRPGLGGSTEQPKEK
jgi:hypothetical protein